MAAAVARGDRRKGALYRRHDDRTAARLPARRRDRRDGGVLLVRHERPDPDRSRHLARRRRLVPRPLYRQGHPTATTRSSRSTRPASANSSKIGAERGRKHAAGHQDGHLRRARRRSEASIDFCEQVGLTYVSCSPFRVPIARLAAAQAALGHRYENKTPLGRLKA